MALNSREKGFITLVIVGAVIGSVWGCFNTFSTIQAGTANKTQLEATKAQKTTDLAAKKAQLQTLEQGKNLPTDIRIRTYTTETLEKNIKEMLDNLVKFATDRSNTLISIEPTRKEGGQAAAPPPPVAAATAPPLDPNAPPPEVDPATGQPIPAAPTTPPIELKTADYTLTFRGSFDTLTDFIESLKDYPELVEIVSIEMSNEAGPERVKDNDGGGGSGKDHLDPSKPIKLQLNVKLLLAPESVAAAPPADVTAPPADGTTPPADGTTPTDTAATPPADGTTPPPPTN